MDTDNKVMSMFAELKELFASLELDVLKNATRGTAAAGVRVRKNLRVLKKKVSDMVKYTVERDKENRAAKAAARAAKNVEK